MDTWPRTFTLTKAEALRIAVALEMAADRGENFLQQNEERRKELDAALDDPNHEWDQEGLEECDAVDHALGFWAKQIEFDKALAARLKPELPAPAPDENAGKFYIPWP